MSTLKEVSAATFAAEVLQSPVPVLVDFWAPWCGPCRMLTPTLEAAEREMQGRAKVVKINVDEQPGLAMQFGVQSIPTIIFFKDGQLKKRVVGVQPKDTLVRQVLTL